MDTGLSQYEQIKVGNMTRRTSGTAIAGLVVGVGAVVAAVGVGAWATAKASEARRVAIAKNEGTEALLNRLAVQYDQYMSQERAERLQGQITLSQSITDTISGQQSASQNQSTSVDNAVSQVMSQTFSTALFCTTALRLSGRMRLQWWLLNQLGEVCPRFPLISLT